MCVQSGDGVVETVYNICLISLNDGVNIETYTATALVQTAHELYIILQSSVFQPRSAEPQWPASGCQGFRRNIEIKHRCDIFADLVYYRK